VKEKIRKKVLKIASSMNYNPKVTARKENIAIVSSGIPDLKLGNFTGLVISTIVKHAMEKQIKIEIVPISDVDIVFENFVRAVIGIVFGDDDIAKLSRIKNIPILTVNNIVKGCHYVCTDHFESTRLATEKLIQKGHSRIALFISPRSDNLNWGCHERIEGYKKALSENGIPFSSDLLVFDSRHIIENIAKLTLMKKPTALIVGGENASMPIWHSLQLLDKKIPEDLSVVLFETPGVTPYMLPTPAVVKQDYDLLGKRILENIMGLLDGSVKKVNEILPVQFKDGDSVRELKQSGETV
jgi:LacI family transcriptional regulator